MAQDDAGNATSLSEYLVCHAKDFGSTCPWPLDYEPKAVVVAKSLDEVFLATNHTEVNWSTRRNVTLLAKGPFRSTSVGDVVIQLQAQPFLCNEFGWTPLSDNCTVQPNLLTGILTRYGTQ